MSIRLAKLYAAGNTHRVAGLAEAIGRGLGLDASTMQGLRISPLVYDIGKIAIPAELLTKPIALSAWEMALIKSHGEAGLIQSSAGVGSGRRRAIASSALMSCITACKPARIDRNPPRRNRFKAAVRSVAITPAPLPLYR